MIPKEIPMSIYRKVQTGPNIQFGGLKGGFVNWAYQPGIAFIVIGALRIPTSSDTMIETITFRKSGLIKQV